MTRGERKIWNGKEKIDIQTINTQSNQTNRIKMQFSETFRFGNALFDIIIILSCK